MSYLLNDLKLQVVSVLERELPKNLYYHNYKHTIEVCKSVQVLAKEEGLSPEEFLVTWTAALFHDTGFLFSYQNNEIHSCRYAREILVGFGFSNSQIDLVCHIIMATSIPHKPATQLENIICDADLDYLGGNNYLITSLNLHSEWREYIDKKILIQEWYEIQRVFMQSHRYFTSSAQKLRNAKKLHNLQEVNKIIMQTRFQPF